MAIRLDNLQIQAQHTQFDLYGVIRSMAQVGKLKGQQKGTPPSVIRISFVMDFNALLVCYFRLLIDDARGGSGVHCVFERFSNWSQAT